MNKKIRYMLGVLCALLVGYIVYDSTSQPGTKDLDGHFTEKALYRNPNNTGPIVRIYAVSVEGSPWEEMEKYGNLMPYTKYGTTTVYFFRADKPIPSEVHPGAAPFLPTFKGNCLAKYEKDANGTVSLRQTPFD
jgi:hypothetical protein